MINTSIISSALLVEALAGQPKAEAQEKPVIGAPTAAVASYSFTEVPVFQFQRHRRTATEIELRAEEVVAAFSDFEIELDEQTVQRWSEEAVRFSERFVWMRPVVAHPNIVVGYNRQYDDVLIVDEFLPGLERFVGPAGPETDIGEMAAYDVFEDAIIELQARGLVNECVDPATATVGYVREWVQAQGETFGWVSEYEFTVNCEVDGFSLLDAGVRLGVHRIGYISSLRVTDIQHEVLRYEPTSLTWTQAESRLAAQLAGQYPAATALHTIVARPAAALHFPSLTGSIEGGYMANYSLEFAGGLSRQHMAHVSLVSGAVNDPISP